jgi:pyridoxal biosynthesis lyase PdxS
MIRTKGEAGTGNVVEAVRHVRSVMAEIRSLRNMDDDEVLVVVVYSFILFWLLAQLSLFPPLWCQDKVGWRII